MSGRKARRGAHVSNYIAPKPLAAPPEPRPAPERTDATIWTGTLRRGAEPNTIEGELVDAWGWRVELRGVRQKGGEYELTGTLGDQVPRGLQQPVDRGE